MANPYRMCRCGHPALVHESTFVPGAHDGACVQVLREAGPGEPMSAQVDCSCGKFRKLPASRRVA